MTQIPEVKLKYLEDLAEQNHYGVYEREVITELITAYRELRDENERLHKSVEDESLMKIERNNCTDVHHDDRWCSHCSSMGDGIDIYSQKLLKAVNDD